MREKRFVRFMKVDENYIANYGGFEYKESTHSKGAGKAQRTSWLLVESSEGAWSDYMDWLRRVSAPNYVLTMIHLGYLELRRECREQGDRAELDDFKAFIRQQCRIAGIPMNYIRHYLKLSWDELVSIDARRLDMQLMPCEFEW